MKHARTLATALTAAALSTLALQPLTVRAASCPGPTAAWESTSYAQGLCGTLTERGRSFGEMRGGITVPEFPFKLYVELFDGIHAFAIAYNSLGVPLNNCTPFDDTEGDGPESVQGAGCLSGVRHNAVVIY